MYANSAIIIALGGNSERLDCRSLAIVRKYITNCFIYNISWVIRGLFVGYNNKTPPSAEAKGGALIDTNIPHPVIPTDCSKACD